MKRLAPALVFPLLIGVSACSAIGDSAEIAGIFPHGGTGQFRILDRDETGVAGQRAISVQRFAFDAAMVADGYLFYAGAPLLESPPEVPAEHPAREVYWDAFEPRAIYRSPPRGNFGFSPGTPILTAEAPWEGGAVFDPWVVTGEDGRVRLYYAAQGGIGVAEADRIDGAFTRVGSGPILADDGTGGVPRRPSVVRGVDGAFWMYFDAGSGIGIARSEDGLTFERVDGDSSTPAIDPVIVTGDDLGDSPEVAMRMPGAVAVDTPAGRRLVRLYYESWREDGSVRAYVAGSVDGIAFERHELEVFDAGDVRMPSPRLLDARVTLLYLNLPGSTSFEMRTYQSRGIAAAVSPNVRLDAVEQD